MVISVRHRNSFFLLRWWIVFIYFLTSAAAVRAQDIAVPVDVHFPLLIKLLSFDRSINKQTKEEIVVGVLFQTAYRSSRQTKMEIENLIASPAFKKLNGVTLWYKFLNIDDPLDMQSFFTKNKLDIIYIAPLRAFDIHAIVKGADLSHILTLTGVPEYVESGIAVGIGLRGDQPQILINLDESRRQGANFSSKLLGLARIIE